MLGYRETQSLAHAEALLLLNRGMRVGSPCSGPAPDQPTGSGV